VPRLTIDGHGVDAGEGQTILDAATGAGVDIPALCTDPRLAPAGACRLCVVGIDGHDRPVAACTTPIAGGMVVHTETPEIEELRRTLLRMLAADYPPGPVTASPGEPFHRLLARYGVEPAPAGEAAARAARAARYGATGPADRALVDDSHPLIHVDLARCISCWRCVRICDEVQGQFAWRIAGRGAASRIVPDSGTTLAASSCVACGACVDTCPTGALEDKTLASAAPPTTWTRTTCPYCAVGCEMHVGAREGRIVAVTPAADAPANRGHLCVKGRYGHGFVAAPDRVTHPLVREGGAWREVPWDEALATAAEQLRSARDAGGPAAVGVLGSARVTNEENYLTQKLARAVLGTNNVDCCARVCHAPSAAALGTMLGTGAATSSFADIEAAGTILVCGTNTTENHPVVGARIKQTALRGAHLVVIDPRAIELAGYADVHLQLRPGTNAAVLNAMAAVIVADGLVDREFLRERVDGFADFARFIDDYAPEVVAGACGVPADDIRTAARLYATAGPALSFHGLGVTEHHQGTEGVMCLVNLALLTGNLGRPGAGVNPLRGQNNVQGAAHMGCEPAHLPGYAPLAQARRHVAAVWGADVPVAPGLDAMEMIDAAGRGELRALHVVGWDILMTQPNTTATRRALERLDGLVVQDLFLNETARELATVFLPAAASFEKDGTFMSSERRIQRVRRAVDPPAGTRSDGEILCGLAAALGRGDLFRYERAEDVWNEIRQVWGPGAGIGYARLDAPGGLQWPCPDDDHPGTAILHSDTFGALGPKATLRTVDYRPPPEQPSDDTPFVLVTGRTLSQFNAGTMTGRSATRHLRATDHLEISPGDAARLGVAAGRPVRVRSRHGEATLPAEVTGRVPAGTVFATFHDPATAVNRLTGDHRDPLTHTPAYKRTAVHLEPASPPTT
jgi:formate dehydrogenase major subunit